MRVHDYTEGRWGHSIDSATEVEPGVWKAAGFGPNGFPRRGFRRMVAGDLLKTASDEGVSFYEVLEVEYYRDPKDMWRLTAKQCEAPEGMS